MRVLALVGPTAAGKTRMSVEVAEVLRKGGHDVEIVSCDSMGVYRRLDIAADKPGPAEQGGVPHHLFDVVDPSETFTALSYRELARAAFEEIGARGGVPMLVGGSGLYFRAAVDNLAFAPTDPEVRERLSSEDPAELYRRLMEADPCSADRIDPRNVRRIVRAVEILELTGRPPTELRRQWERHEGPYDLSVVGLTWDRPVLLKRASERVYRELEAGLVEEVRAAGELSATALQALGVKEIVEHLKGRMSLEEATRALVRNTKRFMRRQLSWFGKDPRVQWVNCSELDWEGARSRIVEVFRESVEDRSGS